MVLLLDKTLQFLTVLSLLAIKGPAQLFSLQFNTVKKFSKIAAVVTLDFTMFLLNFILPEKPEGTVVAKGNPGAGGIWPKYLAPDPEFDSRSPCPYLNCLANHSIINHSGRAIPLEDLRAAISNSLNLSKTMTAIVAGGVEKLFDKKVIDLSDLSQHNVIEHDASAVRADAYFQPDQGKPSKGVINSLLASASRPPSAEHPEGALSATDIAKFVKQRLADSKANNPTFHGLSTTHTIFMADNLALLLDVVDGDVKKLRTILLEERFPDGFESGFRSRMGYTHVDMDLRAAEIYLKML